MYKRIVKISVHVLPDSKRQSFNFCCCFDQKNENIKLNCSLPFNRTFQGRKRIRQGSSSKCNHTIKTSAHGPTSMPSHSGKLQCNAGRRDKRGKIQHLWHHPHNGWVYTSLLSWRQVQCVFHDSGELLRGGMRGCRGMPSQKSKTFRLSPHCGVRVPWKRETDWG